MGKVVVVFRAEYAISLAVAKNSTIPTKQNPLFRLLLMNTRLAIQAIEPFLRRRKKKTRKKRFYVGLSKSLIEDPFTSTSSISTG